MENRSKREKIATGIKQSNDRTENMRRGPTLMHLQIARHLGPRSDTPRSVKYGNLSSTEHIARDRVNKNIAQRLSKELCDRFL